MKNPTLLRRRAATIVAAALLTGGTTLATGASAAVANVSPSDQHAIVSETNSVRQQAGQSSLAWDDSLAKEAQAWADNPASTAGGSLHHGPMGNAAENISSSPPASATGQWASEKGAYEADPNHDTDSPGYREWGHYYNMINGGYGKIGCGTKSGVPTGSITVCLYAP
ncbi:CAP domain-containing protein [Streptomyces sp. NPDC088253]|uniref:CAP domain-containing protein n=1 Tax=Streptomyces sp. NPDC088253 TaxID=3365846 RepID=UPI00383056DE